MTDEDDGHPNYDEFDDSDFDIEAPELENMTSAKLAHNMLAAIIGDAAEEDDSDFKYDDEELDIHTIDLEQAIDQEEFGKIQKENLKLARSLSHQKAEIERLRRENEQEKAMANATKEEQAQMSKTEIEKLRKKLEEQQNVNKQQIENLNNVDGESKMSKQQIAVLEQKLQIEQKNAEEAMRKLQETNAHGDNASNEIKKMKKLLAEKDKSNHEIQKIKNALEKKHAKELRRIQSLEEHKLAGLNKIEDLKKENEEQRKLDAEKYKKLEDEAAKQREEWRKQKQDIQDLRASLEKKHKKTDKKLKEKTEDEKLAFQKEIAELKKSLEQKQKAEATKTLDFPEYAHVTYIKEISNRGHTLPLIMCFFKAGEGSFGLNFNTTANGIYVSTVSADGQVGKYPEVEPGCLLYEVNYFRSGSKSGMRLSAKSSNYLIKELVGIIAKKQDVVLKILRPPKAYPYMALDQYVMSKGAIMKYKKRQHAKRDR